MRETLFHVKGIVHCHTNLSYDGQVSLRNLRHQLCKEGFNFVALSEHTSGITKQDYERFADDCKVESSEDFVVIPGIELRLNSDIEIVGVGISDLVDAETPDDAIRKIHEFGGYAILVHPSKRKRWNGTFWGCDAIEVLNGKVDGDLAPNFSVLRILKKYQRMGRNIHAIFGLDLHDIQEPRNIWTECDVSALTGKAVVESLVKGRFMSRTPNGKVLSSGAVTSSDLIKFLILRAAYISWNKILGVIPGPFRKLFIGLSRPLVGSIKRHKS